MDRQTFVQITAQKSESPYRWEGPNLLIFLRVTPKASVNKIGPSFQDNKQINRLRVSVTAPPEEGKANKTVIELIAKALKIPKTACDIVAGQKERNKTLMIVGLSAKKREEWESGKFLPKQLESCPKAVKMKTLFNENNER
jgi:uncharacterized protein (TIGR00251 family)